MIKATIVIENGKYKSFNCEGHAGFARKGKDIVCSAVSILTINTFNSITELAGVRAQEEIRDGFLSWEFIDECNYEAELLMNSLILGLDLIQKEYNNLLKFETKEVQTDVTD